MQFQQHKVVVSSGTQTILFFMLSVIIILFMLLSNLNSDIEFKSILVFSTVFIASYLLLFSLTFADVGKYLKGRNEVKLFFMQDITIGSFVYVGLGILGVLGVSFASTYISTDQVSNALIGIIGSGLVMLYIFFKTSSVVVVTLIHGAYNSIIYILRSDYLQGKILGVSGINVPEIGINIGSLDRIISEILNQFFLVALSEEMFKVLVMSFVLIGLKGTFESNSGYKYIAGVMSVLLWAGYHLVQSIS